jgi:hypothetical protein
VKANGRRAVEAAERWPGSGTRRKALKGAELQERSGMKQGREACTRSKPSRG